MSGHVAQRVEEAPRPAPVVGVADSDPCVREGLCALLESCGFVTVSYADEGQLPDESLPGCLVLDAGLPGLSLSGLRDRVRALRPHTRVIVTASCPEELRVVELLRAGAVDVLEKPFSPDRLIGLVESVVTRSPWPAP